MAILVGLDRYLLQRKDVAMSDKDTDLKKIRRLIKIMKQNGLAELEIKQGDDKIFLKRCEPQSAGGGPVAAVPVAGAGDVAQAAPTTSAEASAGPQDEDLVEIKSPIVGTFYATPSPDSEPYVEIGSEVRPQTVVCVIEAMKVMNEIKAETSGTIAEVLVTNGQAVEFGEVLFRVRPD